MSLWCKWCSEFVLHILVCSDATKIHLIPPNRHMQESIYVILTILTIGVESTKNSWEFDFPSFFGGSNRKFACKHTSLTSTDINISTHALVYSNMSVDASFGSVGREFITWILVNDNHFCTCRTNRITTS